MTGLSPETEYFARLRAVNGKGEVEEAQPFTTPTARPVVALPTVRNVTGTAAHLAFSLQPDGSETRWRFEYATSAAGPWQDVPGAEGEGIVSQAQAEALPLEGYIYPQYNLGGLQPATTYYVRLFAENEAGEGRNGLGEPILAETRGLASFETSGPPVVSTFAVHALHGESVRLLGTVESHTRTTSAEQTITIGGAPTGGTFTLTFEGRTSAPIPFDAPAQGPGGVGNALATITPELTSNPGVDGAAGGPYTIFNFPRGMNEPPITADASGLTPSGTVTVTVDQAGGEGYDNEYHFEYVSQEQFEKPGAEGGFAQASSTPEVDLGSGTGLAYAGQDVPGLRPGETYRYRLVATSTLPAVVDGEAQSLTVPVPSAGGESSGGACPNAQSRIGPSASLPDCRAYEQLTPVDKEGAQELFNYGPAAESGVAVGEDGRHVVAEDPVVDWGSGLTAGQSPYFFSRDPETGWLMTAAASQPETGVERIVPELYNSDLTEVALAADVYTSPVKGESKEVEFKVGPPGGPYTLVAAVPRNEVKSLVAHEGWAAASQDFSKLILASEDHTLLGHKTGTHSGDDLYEYSDGNLSQANVGIGGCGAEIVNGSEQRGKKYVKGASSSHALSADGSRVFFEAIPGNVCSAAKHLYVRESGAETVDLGEYRFAGANPQGTMLLLEKSRREGTDVIGEFFLYNTEAPGTPPQLIFSGASASVVVSEEFKAIYFRIGGSLYRYDVAGEKLNFLFTVIGEVEGADSASPDGRFYYFQGGVPGVPGAQQVFLYDSAENVVECVSCASPYDSEPRLGAYLPANDGDTGQLRLVDGYPNKTFFSANGEYAFFDTPAALVPADVDGEVAPEPSAENSENQSAEISVSSDVYEWRRDGVHGCARLQGCLALITNGRGGYLNLLLGTTRSGEDVLIYTRSQLVPQDQDNAGDVYDVRVGGGLPGPPPRPTECEASACSTPAGAPNDATPSSSTYQGPGDAAGRSPAKPAAKAGKKPKAKQKRHARKKKRTVGRSPRGQRRAVGPSSRRSK